MIPTYARRGFFLVSALVLLASAPSGAGTLLVDDGDVALAQLGISVDLLGDVNGDGYPDIVVGGPGYAPGGRALVYFGGPVLDNVPDIALGEGLGTSLGAMVRRAGDVNGDGRTDLLVGAYKKAFLFLAAPGGFQSTPALTFPIDDLGSYGWDGDIGAAGDVNGDGFDDWMIGDVSNNQPGRVDVYFGSATPDATPDLVLGGGRLNFGRAVAGVGDLDGDGYDDVVVGQPFCEGCNDPPGADAGVAYVYHGGVAMDATPDQIFTGSSTNDSFGLSLAAIGDVDGDGHPDFAVGSPEATLAGMGPAVGRVRILHGGPTPRPAILNGAAANDLFGWSIAGAGDVNGDGHPDVLVGAKGHANYAGRAELYFGGPLFHLVADRLIDGTGHTGVSVSSAGDMNGDGFADLCVGADFYSANDVNLQGRVIVADGKTTVDAPRLGRVSFLAPVPNPARDHVALTLTLDAPGSALVEAFDVAGRRVATPVDVRAAAAGPLVREWNVSSLPAGLYFLRSRVAGQEQVHRLVHVGP